MEILLRRFELARHVEDYEPPIPEPEVDEQTRKQRTSNSVLQILLSMLGLVVLSALSEDGFGRGTLIDG